MVERKIRLSRESVGRFVRAAAECPFDIDLCYDKVIVDAKSILGVYSLDLSRPLTVSYPDDGKVTEEFENLVNSYAVA